MINISIIVVTLQAFFKNFVSHIIKLRQDLIKYLPTYSKLEKRHYHVCSENTNINQKYILYLTWYRVKDTYFINLCIGKIRLKLYNFLS